MHHSREQSEVDLISFELKLQDVSRQTVSLPFSTHLVIEGRTVTLHAKERKGKPLRLKLLQKFFAK